MSNPATAERHTLKHPNGDVDVDIFKSNEHIEIKLGDTSLSFAVHKEDVVAYVFDISEKRIRSMFPVFKFVEDLRRK